MGSIYTKLEWDEQDKENYLCYNSKEEYLGRLTLMRVGTWMHWCWHDQPLDMFMSPGCLEEVRIKQKDLRRIKR